MRAALGLLAAACVALPLARGGVHLSIELAAALVCSAAAALSASQEREAVPAFVLATFVVPVFIAFQLLPLPSSLLGAVSPSAAALFELHLRPVGLFPSPRPLSLDPAGTARALARAIACSFALVASARLAASPRRKTLLLQIVALSGVAVGAVGMASALVGAAPLLESRVTFANPNHLAGFLNLTAFVSLGLGLRARGSKRLLWLLAFAIAGSSVFLSLSRAGIAAFFLAATTFAILHALRERPGVRSPRLRRVATPLAIGLAVAIAAFLGLDPILREMRTVRTGAEDAKVRMWRQGAAMLREYPLVGIGRGAFAATFPEYKEDAFPLTFTHLENEWLHVPIELGLPVGLLFVATLCWTWACAARSADLGRPEIGAIAGLAAVGAQNAFDFSLELLGVAIPFVVLLGLVARPRVTARIPPWALRGLAGLGAAAAVGGVAFYRAHPCELEPTAAQRARDASEAVSLARAALKWHPADYLPPSIVGVRLAGEGRCGDALPWLQRAMQRNPTAPEPHRAAAFCLSAIGRQSAAQSEYRLAYLMGDAGALDEALRRYRAPGDVDTIVPDLPEALLRAGFQLAPGRPSEAAVLFQRAWTEFGRVDALQPLSTALLAHGEASQALSVARELEAHAPRAAGGYVAAWAALSRLDRPQEAARELELGASRAPGSRELLVPLANAALSARRYAEAHRLAEQILASSPAELSAKRLFEAQVLLASGRKSEALAAALAARDAAPGDPVPYGVISELSATLERYDDAIAALETAAGLPGSSAETYRTRLVKLREARAAHNDAARRAGEIGAPK